MAQLGRTLSIILLLLVALLSIWLSQMNKQANNTQASTEPDWIVHHVRGIERDTNGQVKYQLSADSLTHHPVDDTTSIVEPSFMLHNPQGETWHITSHSATAFSKDSQHVDRIRLQDQVILTQTGQAKKPPLVMTTQSLTVHMQEKFAETPDPVQFIQGQDKTSAVGMRAYLDRKVIELLSVVRGTYVPNS